MLSWILFVGALLLSTNTLQANIIVEKTAASGFIQNNGQIYDEELNIRDDVFFVSSFNNMNIFFTNKGIVYHFYKIEASKYNQIRAGKINNPYSDEEWENINQEIAEHRYEGDLIKDKGEQYRIDIQFPGANLSNAIGEKSCTEKKHYYHPLYPDGVRDVPVWNTIRYQDVYPGIDLVFYYNNGKLKYDFEVEPNADPSNIKILYKGQKNISINENNDAVISILGGEIVEESLVVLQNGKEIPSRFLLKNDTLSYEIGDYDRQQSLQIDPAITWSTYFHDAGTSSAFTNTRPVWDSNGNMYIVFDTYNKTTFPLINPGGGAYYQSAAGYTGLQLVIMKLNTSRQIIWSTYYASSQAASTNFNNQGVVVDQSDNLYVVGRQFFVYASPSPAFPLYNPGGGAYYETALGNNRNFILKFNSNGARLWATMFCTIGSSSSGLDIEGLAIDQNNKLVMTGGSYTPPSWTSMPVVNPGGSHYYVAVPVESSTPTLHRFSTSLGLEWSTYISRGTSGSYCHNGSTIAIDNSNNIFLGSSASGAYSTANPGGAYTNGTAGSGRKLSMFKFLSSGALSWCTLYGGTTSANSVIWQDIRDVKIASNGDVFFVGRVNTTDFPTYDPGGGAYMKTSLSTGSTSISDGVILQFSNTGARKWVTYYGGNSSSDGTDFMGLGISSDDYITVSGVSRSTSFPTLSKAGSYNQSTMSASHAIVLAQFNINGVREWASYIGTLTYYSGGGFGINAGFCGESVLMQFGNANNSYSFPTLNPGGGAYYQSAFEGGGTTTDIFVEFADGSCGRGGTPGLWTWQGTVNDDCFEPCNWDKYTVPTSTSPVLIPGPTPNQPLINTGNAHCLNIEINSTNGARLTINVTNSGNLEVHQ